MVTSSNGSRRWLSRAARRPAKRRDVAGLTSLLALACAAFIGCSSSANTPTDKFVGTWTFDSGMIMPDSGCLGVPASSLTGQTLTLTKGTTSDLVSTLQSSFGTCSLQLTVMDAVASANPGQSCMFTVPVAGNQLMVTFDVTSWTVTSSNGTMMTTNAAATGTGLAAGCMITLSGAATKHATDASAGG
jgi:hypothetical protein